MGQITFIKYATGHYLIREGGYTIGEISRITGENSYQITFLNDPTLNQLFARPYSNLGGAKNSIMRYFETGMHPTRAAGSRDNRATTPTIPASNPPATPAKGLVLTQETITAIHNLAEAAYDGDITVDRCVQELLDCILDEMTAVASPRALPTQPTPSLSMTWRRDAI